MAIPGEGQTIQLERHPEVDRAETSDVVDEKIAEKHEIEMAMAMA